MNYVTCPVCGQQINGDNAFCTNCGNALQSESSTNPEIGGAQVGQQYSKKSNTPIIVAIIILVLIIIGGAVAAVLLLNNDDSKSEDRKSKNVKKTEESTTLKTTHEDMSDTTNTTTTTVTTTTTLPPSTTEAYTQSQANIPLQNRFSVSASSTLANYQNFTYYPSNLIDGNRSTCWAENSNGDGTGEYIMFTSNDVQQVSKMVITNGYVKSEDLFNANNRVKKIKVTLDNGISKIFTLKGTVAVHSTAKDSIFKCC